MLTPSVLLWLSLQLLALALVHAAIRGRWLKNLGALLLLVEFLYQGGTEVVQWLQTKTLAVAGAVTAVPLAGIFASRAASGHESFGANAGFTKRLTALMDGFAAIPTLKRRQAIPNDFVYRFDGNTFGALVPNSLDHGAEPVGLNTACNNVFLAIPSFLNPNKLDTSLPTRNEEFYFDAHFGLPYPTDYLAWVFGTLIGFFGRAGLFLLSPLLGIAFATMDVVVSRKNIPAWPLLGLGVLNCVRQYKQGRPAYPLSLRGVLILILIFVTIRRIQEQLALMHYVTTPRLSHAGSSAGTHPTRQLADSRRAENSIGYRAGINDGCTRGARVE